MLASCAERSSRKDKWPCEVFVCAIEDSVLHVRRRRGQKEGSAHGTVALTQRHADGETTNVLLSYREVPRREDAACVTWNAEALLPVVRRVERRNKKPRAKMLLDGVIANAAYFQRHKDNLFAQQQKWSASPL